jgi:hypothetical protein
MPAGEISIGNDEWIRADGIQMDLKEDETGPFVEITAFLQGTQDALLSKLFEKVMARKELPSLKLRVQQTPTKVLHFDFGGCKPVSGSWQKGRSAWVTFRCYKAGAHVAKAPDRPNLESPTHGQPFGPIALGLLQEIRRITRRA